MRTRHGKNRIDKPFFGTMTRVTRKNGIRGDMACVTGVSDIESGR
nr:hypothetical protein [uncultured Ruminococcus sp.]